MRFYLLLFLLFPIFSALGQDVEEFIEIDQHSEDQLIHISFENMDVEVVDSEGNELSVATLSEKEKGKLPFYCFLVMDETAIFEGRGKSFYEIVNEQIRVSETMKEGFVFISFEVDTIGKMTNFKVVEGLSKENNNEALRVMNLINKYYSWKSARELDRNIKVKTMVYVRFKK